MTPEEVREWIPRLAEIKVAEHATFGSPDRAALDGLVSATQEVIRSAEFRQNLLRYRDLHVSATGHAVSGAEVLEGCLDVGDDRGPVPVTLLDVSTQSWESIAPPCTTGLPRQLLADDRVTVADTTICRDGHANVRGTNTLLSRWKSGSNARRSCAINTLAHELTHTILAKRSGAQLYRDGDHVVDEILHWALVSYTVGSVAQCTYLREPDLERCVNRWGTSILKSGCDDDRAW